MGRPREVATLLEFGIGPSNIAKQLGISFASVRRYLWVAVGEGFIRRSDILFSLPKPLRVAVERVRLHGNVSTISDLRWGLIREKVPFDRNELELIWSLTMARAGHGDLYEFLTRTENLLHKRIRNVLVAQFGKMEWWRRGVQENIRVQCATSREMDPEGEAEPFAYTTLIHLKEILNKQWPLFEPLVPKEFAKDKAAFLSGLTRLNGIRNRIMHPTRLHLITDEDFEFAREMHRRLRPDAWREPVPTTSTAEGQRLKKGRK